MHLNSNPLTEEELDFIDSILEAYQTDESIHNASELDGFVTALVSGPNIVKPSQWLPAIWSYSDQEASPDWKSDDEFTRFLELVMQHMNDSIDMLLDEAEEFEAIFMNVERNGQPVRIPNDWCFGYLRGMAVGGGWEKLPADHEKYLKAITIHTDPTMESKLVSLDQDKLQSMVSAIPLAAQALHEYWLTQRRPDTPLDAFDLSKLTFHAAPKVGRNDPCPCGSGKKFKKCCLH